MAVLEHNVKRVRMKQLFWYHNEEKKGFWSFAILFILHYVNIYTAQYYMRVSNSDYISSSRWTRRVKEGENDHEKPFDLY